MVLLRVSNTSVIETTTVGNSRTSRSRLRSFYSASDERDAPAPARDGRRGDAPLPAACRWAPFRLAIFRTLPARRVRLTVCSLVSSSYQRDTIDTDPITLDRVTPRTIVHNQSPVQKHRGEPGHSDTHTRDEHTVAHGTRTVQSG